MVGKILCKKLNENIKGTKFVIKEAEDGNGEIITTNYKKRFNIRIYIGESLPIEVYFNFGSITYNVEALFELNQFNQKCPNNYVAYIHDNEGTYKIGSFNVLLNIYAKEYDEVIEQIENGINNMFSRRLDSLTKLTKTTPIPVSDMN